MKTTPANANAAQANAAMTKHNKGEKSASGHHRGHDSSIDIEEPGPSEQGVVAFPPQHRLVITTTKGVYIWDVHGLTEVFRSGSKGIVAAKRVASGGEMLAVADSEVVILHEFNGGLQKSYRLKGSEVSIPSAAHCPTILNAI